MENSDKSLQPSGFGMRPRLIQAHGSRKQTQTIVDVPDRRSHEVIVPEMQSNICLGCVYDGCWLLMLDEDTHECFRLCCRPGDEEWTDLLAANNNRLNLDPRQQCQPRRKALRRVAGNLEVMGYIGGAVRSRSLRTRGKVEGVYLVVSDGDIFLVVVEYVGRHYDGSFTRILVHRLDLSSLVWTTVESIGSDRVFLLSSDCGLSSSAAATRLQGNSIYLVWSSCDCESLYKFCLDDMTKSFHQILPEPTTPFFFWETTYHSLF